MSREKADTRLKILEAAQHLLETRGAAATRLADVGRAAGVSRQSVYLHFGSRGKLLVALVGHMDASSPLASEVAAVMAHPDGVEALRMLMRVTAEHSERIHAVAMALIAARDQDEDAAAALEDRLQGRLRGVTRVIQRVADAGRLGEEWTVERASEAIWALGMPSTYENLVIQRGWSVEDYAAYLARAAVALVVAPA